MADDTNCTSGSVVRVVAHVRLVGDAQKQAKVERFRSSASWADRPEELARIEQSILDPRKYQMSVRLSADLVDDRRITGGGFGFGGPRHGVGAIWWRYLVALPWATAERRRARAPATAQSDLPRR
jgi:uncharacterized protein (DUF4415 family)